MVALCPGVISTTGSKVDVAGDEHPQLRAATVCSPTLLYRVRVKSMEETKVMPDVEEKREFKNLGSTLCRHGGMEEEIRESSALTTFLKLQVNNLL